MKNVLEAHITLTDCEQWLVLWAVQEIKERRLRRLSLHRLDWREVKYEVELLESAENKIRDCEWVR